MTIGLEKLVNIDVSRQRIPENIFKEFTMRDLPYTFIHNIEYGYDFWLYGFYFAHPGVLPPNGQTAKLIQLDVEFIKDIRSRTLQNDRYPCRLVSSPGANGTNPVIDSAPKLDFIRYNEPYVFRETIKARFTWHVIPPVDVTAWVMLFGYKVPENSLEMWG